MANNKLLFICVISWFLAQMIKFVVYRIKDKNWDFKRLYEAGGMPSAHSAFVSSLTYSLAYKYGISSDYFTISLAFSLIVMYDAMGIRYETAKHAKVINAMQEKINLPVKKHLNEMLGHRPIEVFWGAVLGVIVSAIGQVL